MQSYLQTVGAPKRVRGPTRSATTTKPRKGINSLLSKLTCGLVGHRETTREDEGEGMNDEQRRVLALALARAKQRMADKGYSPDSTIPISRALTPDRGGRIPNALFRGQQPQSRRVYTS